MKRQGERKKVDWEARAIRAEHLLMEVDAILADCQVQIEVLKVALRTQTGDIN